MTPFPLAEFLSTLPLTLLGIVLLLGVTFAIGVRQRRHAVIDAAWPLGFVVVAVISFVASAGHGDDARRWLLLALTTIWGVRLSLHLMWRLRGGEEDPRYTKLLGTKGPENRNREAIRKAYLPQGAVMFIVSLVQQVGMFAAGPLGWLAWVGIAVWVIGMFFEVVGDLQLARFKADPDRSGILDTGVWAWTRHPNYFGDSAVWWGLFLVTASSWPGVLTVLSPLLMTLALRFVTGVPPVERAMAGRPGYEEYAERTSVFFPLPPRRR
ncbi:MAG: DUF1295 domain-containing protein [bacterium]|nr:DUF1295 domain-containing protein [bacterium]